jgi:hypothetical protein
MTRSPQRTCIISGETLPQGELLRFVVDPEGFAVVDIKGNLPGRGMWLKPQEPLLQQAMKKNAFSRAARKPVKTRPDLPEKVRELLAQRALNYLSRAKQAREVVSGFEKISAALRKGEVSLLLHAADASEDGCEKLDRLAGALEPPVAVHRFLNRNQLSAALGLANPVHLAIKSPDLSAIFLTSYERWTGFTQKDSL